MDYIIIRRRSRRVLNQRFRLVKIRRNLRDASDPFGATTNAEFQRLFRLHKAICKALVDMIEPHMQQRIKVHGLNTTLRILCVLRFLAVGCYQRPIGQDFFIAMSQTSVSRCLDEVCKIIEEKLGTKFIKFKLEPNDIVEMKEIFYNMHGFPGVIDLIDETHICIKKPDNNVEHVYYSSRKAANTKNVQIICDANLKIININARYGGSAHDSFVWNNSIIKTKLMTYFENVGQNTFLLGKSGDSGYGQQPWLMTPFADPRNSREEAYNISHKNTRHLVERCIGVLKSRFRCLSRQRILMYSPQKAGLLINCCAILHNIMLQHGTPLPSEEDILAEMDTASEIAAPETTMDSATILATGRILRDGIANTFL